MVWRADRILYQREKSPGIKILLFPFYLLSLLYGAGVRLRSLLYATGLLKSKRLPCPVISVGNLTVGGTGKTPLVMALAEDLKNRRVSVAILSRGYKGKKTTGPIVSDGKTIFLSPEASGDEPYLMAWRLKETPVLVGKNRILNGRIAFQRFSVRGILLDDGFQHLQLHRDLNILLVDSTIGFGDNHLLPRGILREPLSHLRRADLFMLTQVEHPDACQPLRSLLQKIHPSAPIFHSRYEPSALVGPNGEWEALDAFKGKRILALSGIAYPLSFSALLKKCEMEVIKESIFPDHHRFTQEDLAVLEERRKGTDWIVTTEKDLVRLATFEIRRLPIRALRVTMRVWEEAFFQKVFRVFSNEGEQEDG